MTGKYSSHPYSLEAWQNPGKNRDCPEGPIFALLLVPGLEECLGTEVELEAALKENLAGEEDIAGAESALAGDNKSA